MKVALDMLQNELRSERTLRQVAEASASKMELEVKKLKADLQVRNPASSIYILHILLVTLNQNPIFAQRKDSQTFLKGCTTRHLGTARVSREERRKEK